MNRNQRQRELNKTLSVLPTFTPLNDNCHIYHINQSTPSMLIHDLIIMAQQTTHFTIDTEGDYYTHIPALIQIEFIRTPSIVLLIETCHLPHVTSILFWLISSLIKIIFKSSNTFYAWGDLKCELSNFIHYGLFSVHTIDQIHPINIQHRFKQLYNQTYVHKCGLPSLYEDHLSCTCLYRPVKHKNNQWSLQKAIAYIFNEFLDKHRRQSHWSQRLTYKTLHQYTVLNKKQAKNIYEQRILYAVNDCLAVTKLCMILKLNQIQE